MDWIRSSHGGAAWLDSIDKRWDSVHWKGKDTKKWLRHEIARIPGKWGRKIPTGKKFKLFGEHYRIARQMTPHETKYLRELPLVLHGGSEVLHLRMPGN